MVHGWVPLSFWISREECICSTNVALFKLDRSQTGLEQKKKWTKESSCPKNNIIPSHVQANQRPQEEFSSTAPRHQTNSVLVILFFFVDVLQPKPNIALLVCNQFPGNLKLMPCYSSSETDSYLPQSPVSTIFHNQLLPLCFGFLLHTPMRTTTAACTFCFFVNPPSLTSSPLQSRPLPVKHFGNAVKGRGKKKEMCTGWYFF